MQNEENIPLEIFEWLKHRPFDELRTDEKNLVNLWFSQEEYEDMHLAAVFIDKKEQAGPAGKLKVLARFDEKHRRGRSEKLWVNHYWKLAAVLLPAILFLIFFVMIKPFALGSDTTVARIDTVYVDKPQFAQEKLVHDTVWMEQTQPGSKSTTQPHRAPGALVNTAALANIEEVGGPALEEENEIQNVTRGNSMKDDSLLLLFPSVSL